MTINKNYFAVPRAAAYVGGFFVPADRIEVTRSVYGNADLILARTYAKGTPQDWSAMSQKYMPCTFKVQMGMQQSGQGMTNLQEVISGVLDIVDSTAETDIIELKGRGILATLLDKRASFKPDMNSPISDVVTKLIQDAGLTPQVTATPVKVGGVLNGNDVSMNRNMRILDYINALCFGLGWRVRTKGLTVIAGPPPDQNSVYVMQRQWGDRTGGTKLNIQHSALHAHDIHVRVISYLPHKKARVQATAQGPLAAALGMPQPINSTGKKSTGPTGRQGGSSASASENPNTEEYIYIVPNKTSAECATIAANIANSLTRKEFIMTMTFSPTATELQAMLNAGPEMLINLTGHPMSSNNGLYYPETIQYVWDVQREGLTVNIKATNHVQPVPSGGLPNT